MADHDETSGDQGAGRPRLRHGVLGGAIGGLVFAGIMAINGTLIDMGMLTLPLIGSLFGYPSAWVGLAVHMFSSVLIGALFVLLFRGVERGMVDGLHLGMVYGAVWWFLGPLTLLPVLLGMPIGSQWTLENMYRMFPSLIGHLVYGSILGMTVGLARDRSLAPSPEEEEEMERLDAGVVGPAPVAEAAEPAWAVRERAASGRVPLALSMGIVTAVFLMNLLIFGYGVTRGLPRGAPHEPEQAGPAHADSGAVTGPAGGE